MKSIVFSCEHADNFVPKPYRSLFQHARQILASHRGWDPGAIELAKTLATSLKAPLFSTEVTRLLVEPNRSLGHRSLFSEFSQTLDQKAKDLILETYYWPHRSDVQEAIAKQMIAGGSVLHVSVHTFVPEYCGKIRNADIGLLYDPRRQLEKAFCEQWKRQLTSRRADLRIRKNYPYLGIADGFTTYLRKQFPANAYQGIELEVNQRLKMSKTSWTQLSKDIAITLQACVDNVF